MKALVVNSHSSNAVCLDLFFMCLEKYVGVDYFDSIYLFIDSTDGTIPDYVTVVEYDPRDNFRDQMIHCLKSVKEDVLLYCNEDYLFYAPAKTDIADHLVSELLCDPSLSFVKFCHTDVEKYTEYKSKLYLIDKECQNTFSQTLSFWKTADFLRIHENCPPSEIGSKGDIFGHLEVAAIDVCKRLDIKGVCYYNGEPKRGMVHFDTEVFPHTASALLRGGQWNDEYKTEIQDIMEMYLENNK